MRIVEGVSNLHIDTWSDRKLFDIATCEQSVQVMSIERDRVSLQFSHQVERRAIDAKLFDQLFSRVFVFYKDNLRFPPIDQLKFVCGGAELNGKVAGGSQQTVDVVFVEIGLT